MIDPTELYCQIDDACKIICDVLNNYFLESLDSNNDKPFSLDSKTLRVSEILTILISYHYSRFKCFKHYYLCNFNVLKSYFPNIPSYNRFVERIKEVELFALLYLYYNQSKFGGLGIVDSTSLPVCNRKRTSSHKVFKGSASIGKTSMGWFYGFKLHLIIDFQGRIIKCHISAGNKHDLKVFKQISGDIKGKVFADKGYLGKDIVSNMLDRGLNLITGVRKNMKNKLLTMKDKILLKKRVLVESVFNVLKNTFEISHTRHRSRQNAGVHIITTLIAYCLKNSKPSAKFSKEELAWMES